MPASNCKGIPQLYQGKILVPFRIASALSGVRTCFDYGVVDS